MTFPSAKQKKARFTRRARKEKVRMSSVHECAALRNKVFPLPRPRIERSRDCEGWLCILGDHGWLCGSREHALHEFGDLVRIERTGC
jgi:hypothetical protein